MESDLSAQNGLGVCEYVDSNDILVYRNGVYHNTPSLCPIYFFVNWLSHGLSRKRDYPQHLCLLFTSSAPLSCRFVSC